MSHPSTSILIHLPIIIQTQNGTVTAVGSVVKQAINEEEVA
jgi:hypothetical protein